MTTSKECRWVEMRNDLEIQAAAEQYGPARVTDQAVSQLLPLQAARGPACRQAEAVLPPAGCQKGGCRTQAGVAGVPACLQLPPAHMSLALAYEASCKVALLSNDPSAA